MKTLAIYIMVFLFGAIGIAQKVSDKEYVDQGLTELGLSDVYVKIVPMRGSLAKMASSNRELRGHISGKDGQYIMQISPNLTIWQRRYVIAHELIHLKQYENDSLIILTTNNVTYKDTTYNLFKSQYNWRPWETDAKAQGNLLYKTLNRHFRNQ